jgi:putative transposase
VWVSPTLHDWLTEMVKSGGMSQYRRLYRPGGTYFFTVALADRGAWTLVEEIALLRLAYRAVTAEHPVQCDAMVVLPNHLHAVWTLPQGDADFSTRWKKIKGTFARHCKAAPNRSASKMRKGEKGIWQRRFWEHAIRDDADYQNHVTYCHFNPVKHGLVARPEQWPYSSVHQDIRIGRYAHDTVWASRG